MKFLVTLNFHDVAHQVRAAGFETTRTLDLPHGIGPPIKKPSPSP